MATIQTLFSKKWLWSYLGLCVVFVIVTQVSRSPLATLSASITFASFFILVGIGQMLVITTGPGNIDLSVPYILAFVGSTTFKIMNATNGNIVHGLLLGLVLGAVLGAFNYALIYFILMPPMIATLASSLIIRSINISFFRALQIRPPSGMAWFVNQRVGGVPVLFIFVLVITIVMHIVLTRARYGRCIHAIGQNAKAVWLSGVGVSRYKLLTYMLSGMFAGMTGILLASYIGGATIDMGDEYMLNSIAVVVLGGSSVAGGNSNVVGIVGASILLYMIVNLLNILGLEAGWRYIITGIVIVGIIFIGGDKVRRRE